MKTKTIIVNYGIAKSVHRERGMKQFKSETHKMRVSRRLVMSHTDSAFRRILRRILRKHPGWRVIGWCPAKQFKGWSLCS